MAEEDEHRRILTYMEERFGILPAVFEDYLVFRRKNTWRMLKKCEHMDKAAQLKVEAVGIKAFHRIRNFIKPTTRLIQMFGRHAVKSRITLTKEALDSLARGERLPVEAPTENGYIILFYRGHALGLGLVVNGVLQSQIPKSELRFV